MTIATRETLWAVYAELINAGATPAQAKSILEGMVREGLLKVI
jgi:hypothetical protein